MTDARWQAVARATGLLGADGVPRATVFAEMSALASRTGAVNLGQGFPDVDGPASVARAAADAILGGANQYPPGPGIPALRQAVAGHQLAHYGLSWDPETEVLVTAGATEALAAAVLALAGPGDEVLTLEPFYDSYAAVIAMAGATHTTAPLRATPDGFRLDLDGAGSGVHRPHPPGPGEHPAQPDRHGPDQGRARGDRPAGAGARRDRAHRRGVRAPAAARRRRSRPTHVPMATLPGMAERTLTVSSAGKTFSFTGWKIGWVTGPERAGDGGPHRQAVPHVRLGCAVPAGGRVRADRPGVAAWVDELADSLSRRRDLLCAGLLDAGFAVVRPQGTYFVLADAAPLGYADGAELCRDLPGLAGVVGVPVSAFTHAGSPVDQALRSWVRFTFVKREDVLTEAVARLQPAARLRPHARRVSDRVAATAAPARTHQRERRQQPEQGERRSASDAAGSEPVARARDPSVGGVGRRAASGPAS